MIRKSFFLYFSSSKRNDRVIESTIPIQKYTLVISFRTIVANLDTSVTIKPSFPGRKVGGTIYTYVGSVLSNDRNKKNEKKTYFFKAQFTRIYNNEKKSLPPLSYFSIRTSILSSREIHIFDTRRVSHNSRCNLARKRKSWRGEWFSTFSLNDSPEGCSFEKRNIESTPRSGNVRGGKTLPTEFRSQT